MPTGEFELIEKIRRRAAAAAGDYFGIGDDCAALTVPPGQELLTSTDLLLENIHFRCDWTDLHSLGVKAVAVNVSDIAAMGGDPLCLFLGLGLPARFDNRQVDELLSGIFTACGTYGVFIAGGDTCRADSALVISITIQGLCPQGEKITRAGAVAGEDLWVSGTIGDAALALKLLRQGETPGPYLAARHFRPRARVDLALALRRGGLAGAMLDLSDGLGGDLPHLLRASQLGAQVRLDRLPLSEEFRRAIELNPRTIELALSGGEDYELLFSASVDKRAELATLAEDLRIGLTRIGTLTAKTELQFLNADGTPFTLRQGGYDHFARPGEGNNHG